MKTTRYILGWIFVRPRRWFFHRMIWCTDLQLVPRYISYLGWSWPNLHWWLLYKTVFKLFKWLNYDAWRPLCTWEPHLKHQPWYAKLIQRIGQTTAGFAISGGECYHCASQDGCPVWLSDDEAGKTFINIKTWTTGTPDGTDYRFSGTTICPKCGYRQYYEDGSL